MASQIERGSMSKPSPDKALEALETLEAYFEHYGNDRYRDTLRELWQVLKDDRITMLNADILKRFGTPKEAHIRFSA